MYFIGENHVTLDAKSRVIVPACYRDNLRSLCGGEMVVTLHPDGYLMLFPKPRWNSFIQRIIGSQDSNTMWLKDIFVAKASEVRMDGAGRITLPPHLCKIKRIGIAKEAVFSGVGDYFKVTAPDVAAEFFEDSLERWDRAKKMGRASLEISREEGDFEVMNGLNL